MRLIAVALGLCFLSACQTAQPNDDDLHRKLEARHEQGQQQFDEAQSKARNDAQ